MSNLLSFVSNSFGALDIYTKIYNNPEFVKFMNNMGNTDECLKTLIKNGLHKQLDERVKNYIENKNNDSIFFNNNISRTEQTKMYIGRVMIFLYETNKESLETNGIEINKEQLLMGAISGVNICIEKGLMDCSQVRCGVDVYVRFIDVMASNIAENIFKGYTDFQNDNADIEKDIFAFAETIIGKINNIFAYETSYKSSFPEDTDNNDNDDDGGNGKDGSGYIEDENEEDEDNRNITDDDENKTPPSKCYDSKKRDRDIKDDMSVVKKLKH